MLRDSNGNLCFNFRDIDERKDALKTLMNETPEGAEYLTHYDEIVDKDEHSKLLYQATDVLFPDNDCLVSIAMLAQALRTLIDSGKIKFTGEGEAVLEDPSAPAVDPTPRDRNGKALTQSQLAWGEMTKFANESSMDAIRQRKYVDPKFRSFVETNMRREFAEQPVADGVENLNANRTPQARGVAEDVRAFATRYRTMSVADAKKLLSPGMNPDGPDAARKANALFDAACAANLI